MTDTFNDLFESMKDAPAPLDPKPVKEAADPEDTVGKEGTPLQRTTAQESADGEPQEPVVETPDPSAEAASQVEEIATEEVAVESTPAEGAAEPAVEGTEEPAVEATEEPAVEATEEPAAEPASAE